MNNLISHIEFLLHTHDCVIIPNFGGFVLNFVPVRRDGLSAFDAPASELLFNRELMHNDGLLAESFMKVYNIGFAEANNRIDRSVNELKTALQTGEKVPFGALGTFRLNEEKNYVFLPEKFIRPEHFGLAKVALQPVIQVQPAAQTVKKQVGRKTVLRNAIVGATAAAAVTAAVLLLSPFEKNIPFSQKANMVSESGLFSNHTAKQPENKTANAVQDFSKTVPQVEAETANPVSETESAPASEVLPNAPKYYIVMGVYEVREVAEQITEILKSEGFSQTAWIERQGRIDVYVASFSDKVEAETYLKEMRAQHRNHADAWVMKR